MRLVLTNARIENLIPNDTHTAAERRIARLPVNHQVDQSRVELAEQD